MTASASRLAYTDIYAAMDKAKADKKGIRIRFADKATAQTFQARVHQARKIDRVDNTAIYEPDDPLYGKSVYDTLITRLRQDTEGRWWVYLERLILKGEIESLSDGEEEIEDASGRKAS